MKQPPLKNVQFTVVGDGELAGAAALEISIQNVTTNLVTHPGSRASSAAAHCDVKIIEGAPATVHVLTQADLTRATHLVLFPSSLSEMLVLLEAASEVYQSNPDGTLLNVFACLPNRRATLAVRNGAVTFSKLPRLYVQCFFLPEDIASDLLFKEFGPDTGNPEIPRYILFGSGIIPETLALRLARLGQDVSGSNVKVDWIVPESEVNRIPATYPYLNTDRTQLYSHAPGSDWTEYVDLQQSSNWVLISCLQPESLEAALGITEHRLLLKISRIYNLSCDAALTGGFQRRSIERLINGTNVRPLGEFSALFSIARFLELGRFGLAKAVHLEYCRAQQEKGELPQDNSSLRRWDEIGEDLRHANVEQADHMLFKLRCLGYRIEKTAGTAEPPPFSFTAQEIESLARLEHARWFAERESVGWKYGKVRINELKQSPAMVPYDELSEPIKEKDRQAVRTIPGVLRRLGLSLSR